MVWFIPDPCSAFRGVCRAGRALVSETVGGLEMISGVVAGDGDGEGVAVGCGCAVGVGCGDAVVAVAVSWLTGAVNFVCARLTIAKHTTARTAPINPART